MWFSVWLLYAKKYILLSKVSGKYWDHQISELHKLQSKWTLLAHYGTIDQWILSAHYRPTDRWIEGWASEDAEVCPSTAQWSLGSCKDRLFSTSGMHVQPMRTYVYTLRHSVAVWQGPFQSEHSPWTVGKGRYLFTEIVVSYPPSGRTGLSLSFPPAYQSPLSFQFPYAISLFAPTADCFLPAHHLIP